MTKSEKAYIIDMVSLQDGYGYNKELIKKLFLNFLSQKKSVDNMLKTLDEDIKNCNVDNIKSILHSIRNIAIEMYAIRMKNVIDKMEYLFEIPRSQVDYKYLSILYNVLLSEYEKLNMFINEKFKGV